MQYQNPKVYAFTDLVAWKEAHHLLLTIYTYTQRFPNNEQFGLTNQIRRAVVSITSNIAEGFSRGGMKEKTQFYRIALGSLTETHNQLIIAKDLEYISEKQFIESELQIIKTSKLIQGLLKFINQNKNQ